MELKNIWNEIKQEVRKAYREGSIGLRLAYTATLVSLVFGVLSLLVGDLTRYFILRGEYLLNIWTYITYPLVYPAIIEVILGGVALYYTEKIFRLFFNQRSVIKFLVIGNIFGIASFIFISLFITKDIYLYGLSMSIYVLLFASVSYSPRTSISLMGLSSRFPLYILAIGIVLMELLSSVSSIWATVPKLIAGAVGYLYMKRYNENQNDFFGRIIDRLIGKAKREMKNKEQKNKFKEDLSPLLNKVSQFGYDSLTEEEKEKLFKK